MNRELFLQAVSLNSSISQLETQAANYQKCIDSITDPGNAHSAESVFTILKMNLNFPDFRGFALDWLKELQGFTESEAAALRHKFNNL